MLNAAGPFAFKVTSLFRVRTAGQGLLSRSRGGRSLRTRAYTPFLFETLFAVIDAEALRGRVHGNVVREVEVQPRGGARKLYHKVVRTDVKQW